MVEGVLTNEDGFRWVPTGSVSIKRHWRVPKDVEGSQNVTKTSFVVGGCRM